MSRANKSECSAKLDDRIDGRRASYLVAVLTIIGAALRAVGVFTTPVDLDEGYTILTARLGLIEPILRGPCDRNPIGAHIPHALWAELFGSAKSHLELVSFLAGVALIPLVFLLGRELFSRRSGLTAAGLVALSGFHLFYSRYVRVYSVAVFVSCLGLLFFCRWRTNKKKSDGVIALCCAFVVVNLHYYGALAVGAVIVFLVLSALVDPVLRRAAVISSVVVFVSALPTVLWQARVLSELKEPTWMAAPGLQTFASIWFHLASRNIPLMVALLSFALFAVRRGVSNHDWRIGLLVSGVSVPLLVSLIFSLTGGSVFHLRYFIFISVPFLLLCAEGMSALPKLRSAITSLVSVLAILGARGEVLNDLMASETAVRHSPLGSVLPNPRTADPESALVFTSKCGYVSAAVDGLFQGPAYLLKSSDDAWVLKCIAGSEIEADKEALRRFRKIVLVNQGCPPVPARTAICREDALTEFGFVRSSIWGDGSVCEFEKPTASDHN